MARRQVATGARFAKLLQPVIDAIGALGGSARPAEVKEQIRSTVRLPVAYLQETHAGGESKFGNDVDWARFYLVRSGLLDNSKRGVWSLTEKGKAAKIDDAMAMVIIRAVDRRGPTDPVEDHKPEAPPTESYVDQALALLKSLSAKGFENLCQRLLRESGFEEVNVTGRSGDGGIDGEGILKVNPFVSFRVLFQCKRHKDSVSPSIVRDFRGAMVGRAEKGIILTTGYFTSQAEQEASRDGADPIELVDGEALVAMLAQLELGLRPVTTYEVDSQFFDFFK
jgi:restriction system protein